MPRGLDGVAGVSPLFGTLPRMGSEQDLAAQLGGTQVSRHVHGMGAATLLLCVRMQELHAHTLMRPNCTG